MSSVRDQRWLLFPSWRTLEHSMGQKAKTVRLETKRTFRAAPLSPSERERLAREAFYEGSPYHKKEPNDFGLQPPTAPRADATLCDEAGIHAKTQVQPLFQKALARGLVSANDAAGGFPKQMWVVDGEHVYELMYGGSRAGAYHGYPIRRSDPLFAILREAWD